MLLFTTSCDSEIDQTVHGSVMVDGKANANVQVSLQNKNNDTCREGITAITDNKGVFSFHRKAEIGTLAVIVQEDLLCIQENGKWLPVWRGIYGPAPKVITFSCDRAHGEYNCTMNGMIGLPIVTGQHH